MVRQLRRSPEAVEDVEAIAHYIERDSSYYARAVVSRIVSLADTIPEQPEMGRVVPELRDPIIGNDLYTNTASFIELKPSEY